MTLMRWERGQLLWRRRRNGRRWDGDRDVGEVAGTVVVVQARLFEDGFATSLEVAVGAENHGVEAFAFAEAVLGALGVEGGTGWVAGGWRWHGEHCGGGGGGGGWSDGGVHCGDVKMMPWCCWCCCCFWMLLLCEQRDGRSNGVGFALHMNTWIRAVAWVECVTACPAFDQDWTRGGKVM